MTASEVATMCEDMTLDQVEAMEAEYSKIVRSLLRKTSAAEMERIVATGHGASEILHGAGDTLWLIRDYLEQRRAAQ